MEKRLYKSRENRALCGVCGGIGEYFNIDPVIIRLLVVVFTLCGGAGLIGYIIAAIIIPEKDKTADPESFREKYSGQEADEYNDFPEQKKSGRSGTLTLGIILLALGAFVGFRAFAPWIPEELILAVLLIALGIYFVIRRSN